MPPKKRHENKFFPPLSFIAVFGSGEIQDPGSEIWDPEWVKIRIWDPGLTSRIRNTAKNLSVSSQKYAVGIRDLQTNLFRIPDPGQASKRPRIQDPNPQH